MSLLPKTGTRISFRRRRDGRERPPLAYAIGLMGVAAAAIVLPFFYLAIASAVLWLVGMHAIARIGWIVGSEAGLMSGITYLVLLLFGSMMVVFLFRPLFSERRRPKADLTLAPGEEPRLHAFVQQICTALGAPTPERIQVSMDVNASARLAAGICEFLGRQPGTGTGASPGTRTRTGPVRRGSGPRTRTFPPRGGHAPCALHPFRKPMVRPRRGPRGCLGNRSFRAQPPHGSLPLHAPLVRAGVRLDRAANPQGPCPRGSGRKLHPAPADGTRGRQRGHPAGGRGNLRVHGAGGEGHRGRMGTGQPQPGPGPARGPAGGRFARLGGRPYPRVHTGSAPKDGAFAAGREDRPVRHPSQPRGPRAPSAPIVRARHVPRGRPIPRPVFGFHRAVPQGHIRLLP